MPRSHFAPTLQTQLTFSRRPKCSIKLRRSGPTTDSRTRLSFETGGPGLLLQDGEVRNMDSDLVFDRWGDEVLSVGRQGRVQSAFRDLGDLKLEGTLGSAFYRWSSRTARSVATRFTASRSDGLL